MVSSYRSRQAMTSSTHWVGSQQHVKSETLARPKNDDLGLSDWKRVAAVAKSFSSFAFVVLGVAFTSMRMMYWIVLILKARLQVLGLYF